MVDALDHIIKGINTSRNVISVVICANFYDVPIEMSEFGKCNIYSANPELKEIYKCPFLKEEHYCGKDPRTRLENVNLIYS